MTKQVLISLLRQGNTGNEILNILDVITADQDDTAQPTLEEVQF
jgi:hypothetical protein